MNNHFAYGMDISSLPSLEKQGLDAFKGDELLLTLKASGVNTIRLRLWVNPYDTKGYPYGGGTNDLKTTIKFAHRIIEAGLNILLDFHYSDFWADPGKQFMPKAWRGLSHTQLVDTIYHYTRDVLLTFKQNMINIKLIQTGNEITNGMMWNDAKLYEKEQQIEGGFARLSDLLKSASRACIEVYPNAERIIHLDRGGDLNLYQYWFNKINEHGMDYDIIGLSYYPYWHGTLDDLANNIIAIKKTFNKKIMIMETSYAFKDESGTAPLVMTSSRLDKKNDWPPYSFTKSGQAAFIHDLISLAFKLEIDGLFYWEPAWLLVSGDTWATKEGREYINETHKVDGNEWANQALFDVDGKANPALAVYKTIKGEDYEKK